MGRLCSTQEMRNVYRVLVGQSVCQRPLKKLRGSGRLILKWSIRIQGLRMWIGFKWLGIGSRCCIILLR
jgi:hypothetical protein